jgi:hypothetical protein
MKPIYGKYIKVGASLWAVCFIVLLSFYLLVLAPQERGKAQGEKRLADVQGIAQTAREASKPQTRARLEQHVADSDQTLKDFVAEQEDIDDVKFAIRQIEDLDSFGIPATGSEGFVDIENCNYVCAKYLNVKFASSFNKFAAFLNALETGPLSSEPQRSQPDRNRPVIFIDTFSITRARDGVSGHPASMKLVVLVGKDTKTKGADG